MSCSDLRAGDYGTSLVFLVKDQDGAVVDLSAPTTATLYAEHATGSPAFSGAMAVVTDGTDGRVFYTLQDGDIPATAPGTWRFQVEVTTALPSVWRTGIVSLLVGEAL